MQTRLALAIIAQFKFYVRQGGKVVSFDFACRTGEDFYVQGQRFICTKISSPTSFSITRERDGSVFAIIDDGIPVEILPGVELSVGLRGQVGLARLALHADASIPIDRGENFRKSGGHRPRTTSG